MYRNPPIDEALCEFRFKSCQDWDLTVPGRLYAKLENKYPGKPRDQKAVEIGLDIQEGSTPNMKYNEGLARVQLLSRDERKIVGVGPNTVTIHILKPYQDPNSGTGGWQDFKSRISDALAAYWDVAKPEGICRVGIRYINKMTIPQENPDIQDYLQIALPGASELPKNLTRFINQVEYEYQDEVRLILSQGYADMPEKEYKRELILDLDVIWSPPEPVLQEKALEMVDDLRGRERKAFEAIITDKTRELFNA